MKNILLVEDELLIALDIQNYLESKEYNIIGIAISCDEAIEIIKSKTIDIILIDIVLYGKKSGLDLAEYILKNHQIPFLFLSSHTEKEFITKAKTLHPKAFLTKPIQKESLFATLEMVFHSLETTKENSQIAIIDGQQTYFIEKSEIEFIKSSHVYLEIYLAGKGSPIITRNTLKNILIILDDSNFFSPHRSYIINLNHVKSIIKQNISISNHSIPISRNLRNELIEIIQDRNDEIFS